MNPKVDHYFIAGCGRCPLADTPECKVHNWQEELQLLRSILLECGLTEELKWGVPCYTFQKNNVIILGAFKEYCMISFFKGALLSDTEGILTKPGENTQAGRVIRFTNVKQVVKLEAVLKAYIYEAIEVEKSGAKVTYKKADEYAIPDELTQKFKEDPEFKKAFYALTPGRQKGYIIHFSQPKQSATRVSRIEKCMSKIFEGKGFNDYK